MLLEAQSAIEYLDGELLRRTRGNSQYTLRAFARDLGLSPGEMSEILRRKRNLTLKTAAKISEALGMNADEERHFFRLVRNGDVPPVQQVSSRPETLSVDVFHVVADWYCFAILNLAQTKNFRWDAAYISRRLGISMQEVRDALLRLERVGLVERVGDQLRVAKDFVLTTEGIPSEAIRNYHRALLEKARVALDTQPIHERYFSGMGFALSQSDIAEVQKDLGSFLQQLAKKYQKNDGSDVYQIELGFFRLSERND